MEEGATGMEAAATAVIRVDPGADRVVVALRNEVAHLLGWAKTLEVRDVEGMKRATDDLTLLATLKRAIEDKRKEYIGPVNDHVKAINESFKSLAVPLEDADRITRGKILAYRREEERKIREAEEINRLREEAARREMELKGEITEPVGIVEVAPPPPSRVQTEVGSLGTTKTRKWEVEDITKIPPEYLAIDAARVGRVVRAGIPSIPGIRIWEEEGLRVTPMR